MYMSVVYANFSIRTKRPCNRLLKQASIRSGDEAYLDIQYLSTDMKKVVKIFIVDLTFTRIEYLPTLLDNTISDVLYVCAHYMQHCRVNGWAGFKS